MTTRTLTKVHLIKALVEGRAKPETLRRIFSHEDVLSQMRTACSRDAAASLAVATLAPAVGERLAAAGVTPDRALHCSASTAALLRWCSAAVAAAAAAVAGEAAREAAAAESTCLAGERLRMAEAALAAAQLPSQDSEFL
jgi:hypothetical protein